MVRPMVIPFVGCPGSSSTPLRPSPIPRETCEALAYCFDNAKRFYSLGLDIDATYLRCLHDADRIRDSGATCIHH
eukprot:791881-Pyramimonas_sp.AAC.1